MSVNTEKDKIAIEHVVLGASRVLPSSLVVWLKRGWKVATVDIDKLDDEAKALVEKYKDVTVEDAPAAPVSTPIVPVRPPAPPAPPAP